MTSIGRARTLRSLRERRDWLSSRIQGARDAGRRPSSYDQSEYNALEYAIKHLEHQRRLPMYGQFAFWCRHHEELVSAEHFSGCHFTRRSSFGLDAFEVSR
jgi:hypothetical protein